MCLEQLKDAILNNNEKRLINILEDACDKVRYKHYTEEEIIIIANELIKINILNLCYDTREEILYFLAEVSMYYNIKSKINWDSILILKNKLENDLQEYIEEILFLN